MTNPIDFGRTSNLHQSRVELDRSTLADWVGGSTRVLTPLVDAVRKYGLCPGKVLGDDVPVPVLAPGNGKTSTGRLWTYVRDDQQAGSRAAPAVWFRLPGQPVKHHLNVTRF